MMWLFAVVVVIIMGITAVVATGRGGGLSASYADRPDVLVPVGRQLTADDLRQVRFTTAVRGYRMTEVDALLDRIAAELEERNEAGGPDEGEVDAEDPSR